MSNITRERWADLEIKTKIAYITAIIAFIVGWGLTIAGFCMPPVGEITESVLWVLGQALVYTASIFGVGMYVTGSVRGMRRDIKDFMREEHRQYHIESDNEEQEEEV